MCVCVLVCLFGQVPLHRHEEKPVRSRAPVQPASPAPLPPHPAPPPHNLLPRPAPFALRPACRRRDHARLEVQNTGRMLATMFLEGLYQREALPGADGGGGSSGSSGGPPAGGSGGPPAV